jgi:site-specific DNA-methyltransferase (adenine-specific)
MSFVVHHGDCLATLQSLPDHSVDAVITDPPYSSGGLLRGDRMQSTVAKYVSSDSGRRRLNNFTGDNRDQRSFAYWCALWLSECRRIAKPGAAIVQFTDWRQLPVTTDAIQAGGWVWRGVGVWAKKSTRPQMGRFNAAAEFFVWGSNGPMPANADVGCLPGVITAQTTAAEKQLHVTPKPVEMMRTVVRVCPPGGTILDPFAGSGSTGVAAILEGRRFVGVEADESYAALARSRVESALRPLVEATA